MTFGEYLESKKIEAKAFAEALPLVYQEWLEEFGQVHPASFTARHLFSINKTRRNFPLKPRTDPAPAASPTPAPARPRPVLRPKTT